MRLIIAVAIIAAAIYSYAAIAAGPPLSSNQEITILNPNTHVKDNEVWTVSFKTSGTADLIINSTNAEWRELLTGTGSEEMEFLDITCGDNSLKEKLIVADENNEQRGYSPLQQRIKPRSFIIPDYSCDETSRFSNLMHVPGYATLMFTFGGQAAFAYDPAPVNISFNTTTDSDNAILNRNHTYINLTITNGTTIDAAGIEWNGTNITVFRGGLVGLWHLDNNTNDSSGFLGGGSPQQGLNCSTVITGKFGTSCHFNGSGFINVSNNALFNLPNAFTLMAWVKPDSVTDSGEQYAIIAKWVNGGNSYILEKSDATVAVETNIGGIGKTLGYLNAGLAVGKWSHIAATYNGSLLVLYANATQIGNTSATGAVLTSSTNLLIGAAGTIRTFNGSIDEVRIWNRSISTDELAILWRSEIGRYYANITENSFANYSYYGWVNETDGTYNRTATRNITFAQASCIVGGGCYSTLQDAVDAASEGSEIELSPVTSGYHGPVTINKKVRISSNSTSERPLIVGGSPGITINANGTVIEDLAVNNSEGTAIWINQSSHVIIRNVLINTTGTDNSGINNSGTANNPNRNNTIINSIISTTGSESPGILSNNSWNSAFDNNTINTSGTFSPAIRVVTSNFTNVSSNTINTSANNAEGISFATSSWNNVTQNTIRTTGTRSFGINLTSTSSNNLVQGNTVLRSGSTAYGVYVVNGNYNNVTGNIINSTGTSAYGVYVFAESDYNSIDGNGINVTQDDTYPIVLQDSGASDPDFNTVARNTVRSVGSRSYAIYLNTNVENTLVTGNVIRTTNTNGWGIEILTSINNNITGNNITTSGSIGYGIELANSANTNNVTDNRITVSGLTSYGIYLNGANSNNLLQGNTITVTQSRGIYLSSASSNKVISNTVLETTGLGTNVIGIMADDSSNLNITGNSVNTTVSSAYGIYLTSNSDKVAVDSNRINTTASSAYGIFMEDDGGINDPDFNNVTSNVILTVGTTAHGIYLETDAENTIVKDNIINTTSTGIGIFLQNNINNNITANNITTSANATFGIRILDSNYSNYTNNIVTTYGNRSFAVQIERTGSGNLAHNNTFTNNVFNTTALHVNITAASGANNFSLSAITAGTSIVGGSNLGGNFYDNSTSGGQAAWSKNCTDANGDAICDTSLTHAASNVDFFPLTLPVECGSLDTASKTYVMSKALSAAGTCFTVAADSVTLDCNGYTVTYATSTNGSGIDIQGYNSTTVRNCIITQSNYSVQKSPAIFALRSNNSIFGNNTINTTGNYSYGIELQSSNFTNVSSNVINTTANFSYGISLLLSGRNNLTENTVRTLGTSNTYGMNITGSNNTLVQGNTVSTRGTGANNYGIYLLTSSNNNLTSNTINTSGTDSNTGIVFSSSSTGTATNNTINTSGTSSDNYGIYFFSSNTGTANTNTITTSGTSSDNYGIFFGTGSSSGTANTNTIRTSGTTNNFGIVFSSSSTGTATNNTINTSGTSGSNFGVYLIGNSDNNNISSNTINTSGSSSHGIFLEDSAIILDPDFNNITNNVILTVGATAHGIYVETDAENTIVKGNVINTTSTGYGIAVERNFRNNFTGNNITTSANNAFGIYILNANGSNYTDNIVKTTGSNAFAVQIDNTTTNLAFNNTFTNNVFNTTALAVNVTHPSSSYQNNFSLSAITAGTNIVGGSNLGGNFYDNSTSGGQAAWSLNCTNNGRGICDTSLTHAASNVDFFPLAAPTSCRALSTAGQTYTLDSAATSTGTCFQINASSITLDCNGYTVTYATTSAGYGVNITGFNSTTVKNCNFLQQNGTVMNSTGIFALGSNNSIFSNNSINTTGNYSYGVELQNSNFTNVSSNIINTTANFSYGISLLNSNWNNVTNNTIRTNGTNAYGVNLTSSSRNSLVQNNINTSGSLGYGISLTQKSNYNNIDNNTVYGTIGVYADSISTSEPDDNTITNNILRTTSWGIYFPQFPDRIVISNNTLVGGGIYGEDFRTGNITGNSINSSTTVAIRLTSNSISNRVSSNNINTTCTSCYGIYLDDAGSSDPDLNTLTNNVILTVGATAHGIYLETDAELNRVINNVINTTSTGQGIRVESNTLNNITGNNITTSANDAFGIYILNAKRSNYTDNIVKTTGSNAFGVQIDNTTTSLSVNNTFTNNIFNTTALAVNVTHPSSNYINNFSLSAITAGTNIVGGSNLGGNWYGNSTVGGQQAWSENCTDSNGDAICDTSLTHATNNVDFFPLTLPVECGSLSTASQTYVMSKALSATGTCFTVAADSVTLDCNGYTVTYATTSAGYGVNITGFNSTTVRNCNFLQQNGTVMNSTGIFALRSNNSIFGNNTINTTGNFSYGIELQRSNFTNVSSNTINTTANFSYGISLLISGWTNATSNTIRTIGTSAYGVNLTTPSNNNLVQSNTVITSGSSATGVFVTSSNSNIITGNTINASLYGIYLPTSTGNNITGNTINASSFGIYLLTSTNNNITSNNVSTSSGGFQVSSMFLSNSSNNAVTGNTIRTVGTSSSDQYGVYLLNSTNNAVTGNTVNLSGATSNRFAIYLLTNSNNNVVTGNRIYSLGSVNRNYGIFLSSSSSNNVTSNNISTGTNTLNFGVQLLSSLSNAVMGNVITTTGTGADNYGIYLSSSSNNNVTDNTVNTSGTSVNYGIYLLSNSDSNNLTGNAINTSGSTSHGIFLEDSGASDPDFNNVTNNVILTVGTTAHGIYVETDSENTLVKGNVINTTSTGIGIFLQNNKNNNITANNITTSAAGAFGIRILDSNYSNYTNNIVKTTGANSFAVQIERTGSGGLAHNNTFTNNVFNTTALAVNITAASGTNNFSLSAITAGTNIVGGSSLGGNFYDNSTSGGQAAWSLNCTDSNGDAICDTSLTHATNNVDFFPLTLPVECGSLSTASQTYVMSKALSATGTCFTVAATGVTLDCNGYTVTYATSTNGSGIDIQGYNSTTVKNCIFRQTSASIGGSPAVNTTNSNNSIFHNNTINTTGTFSPAIRIVRGNYTNVSSNTINTSANNAEGISMQASGWNNATSNTIRTTGTSAYGINLTGSSSNNELTNIRISTSGSTAYGIYFSSSRNNSITSSNITTSGTSANGITLDSNNSITSSNITTSGTSANGITLDSNNNITSSNITTSQVFADGIVINSNGASNNIISNNITTSAAFADGIVIGDNSNRNSMINNTISASIGISLSESNSDNNNNNVIDNTITSGGISSTSDQVSNDNITGNTVTGSITFSGINTNSNNNISNNIIGGSISLSSSYAGISNYIITGNVIKTTGTAISLSSTNGGSGTGSNDRNRITGNTINTTTGIGISLSATHSGGGRGTNVNNSVTGNTINTTTGTGISLSSNKGSSGNINNNITYNAIITTGNAAYGINLANSSNSNITGNNITTTSNNSFGIVLSMSNVINVTGNIIKTSGNLSFAVQIERSSANNSIYNNIFNTTTWHVNVTNTANSNNFSLSAITAGTNIVSGSRLGGNYYGNSTSGGQKAWSENCTDSNGDAICDTSLTHAASNVDFFPLAVADTVPPLFYNNGTNSTSPKVNEVVGLFINWSDVNRPLNFTALEHNFSGGSLVNATVPLWGTDQNVTFNITVAAAKGQPIVFKFYGNDSAGNRNSTAQRTLTVGNTAPATPAITTPAQGGAVTDFNHSLNYSSSDVDGDSITFYIYLNATFNKTAPANTTMNLSGGSYGVNVSAYDGTDFSANATVAYSVDNPPATPTIIFPANNAYVTTANHSLNYSSSDADGHAITYYIFLDAVFNKTRTANTTMNLSDRKSYLINVSAYDGLAFSANSTVNYTVDTTAPTFANNGSNVTSIQVNQYAGLSINATDNLELSFITLEDNFTGSAANTTVAATSSPFNVTFNRTVTQKRNNDTYFRFYVNDSAGNAVSTVKQTITVTNTIPSCSWIFPSSNMLHYSGNISLNASCTDPDSDSLTYYWYVNSSFNKTTGNNFTTVNFTAGNYAVNISASDGTGFSSNATIAFDLTSNITLHATTLRNWTVHQENISAAFIDPDGAADIINYSIATTSGNCKQLQNTSSGQLRNFTFNCTGAALDAHTITITVNDTRGNVSKAILANAYPDSALSTPVIIFPENNGFVSTANHSLNYSSSDADGDPITYYIWLNQALNHTATTNTTMNLSDGNYQLNVSAFAGAQFSAGNGTVNYTVDTGAPVITSIRLLSNSSFLYQQSNNTLGAKAFFNSRAGEGSGQVIGVEAGYTDTNPFSTSANLTFGDTVTNSTSVVPTMLRYVIDEADGNGSTLVTVMDRANWTDTAVVNWTLDINDTVSVDSSSANYWNAWGNTTNVTVNISSSDSLSGLNRTYYCFYDTGTAPCIPTLYASLRENQKFDITLNCSVPGSCQQAVRYYSMDNVSNNETIRETHPVYIKTGAFDISDSVVNNSKFYNGSFIQRSNITNTTVQGACRVVDSIVIRSTLKDDPTLRYNCSISESWVIDSNITSAIIEKRSFVDPSTIVDSVITNSTVLNSTVNFSRVESTVFCGNFTLWSADVLNNVLVSGRLEFNGSVYFGPMNLSSICAAIPSSPVGQLSPSPSTVKDGDNVTFTYAAAAVGYSATISSSDLFALDNTSTRAVTLNDNGNYPDAVANDAVYSANYSISINNNQSDGNKTVVAQVFDNLGNNWTVRANVTLDNTLPNASVVISDGAATTSSRTVTLQVGFNDTIGVQKCRFANEDRAFNVWEPCASANVWGLSAGDGVKTVVLQVADNAWNINETNDTITLAATAGEIFGTLSVNDSVVNNGSSILFTFLGSALDLNVSVNQSELRKLDNTSGSLQLNDSGINGDLVANDATYSGIYTISMLNNISDGMKQLIAEANNSVGSIFRPAVNITLDNARPNASVTVLGLSPAGFANVSSEYTSSRAVTLVIGFNDTAGGTLSGSEGIDRCRFANENQLFSDWEVCQSVKSWLLSESNGNKTVVVEVWDLAGNVNRTNDTIYLNTTGAGLDFTPPSTPTVVDDGTYTSIDSALHARWNATDYENELLHLPLEWEYRIAFDNFTKRMNDTWQYAGIATDVTVYSLNLSNSTNYTFEVRAINTAGIRSVNGTSDGIIIDTAAPDAPSVSSTHSQTAWSSSNAVSFNWSSNDTLSGVVAYSYLLDSNATTIPDNVPEAENEHTTLASSYNDGKSTIIKFNNTGNATAVFIEVKSNLSANDVVRVTVQLAEASTSSPDAMGFRVYLITAVPTSFAMNGSNVSLVVDTSTDVSFASSLLDATSYTVDVPVSTAVTGSRFFVAVAGDVADDNNRHNLRLATSNTSMDSSTQSYRCLESDSSCTNTTATADYGVKVEIRDVKQDSIWDRAYAVGDGRMYFHVKAKDGAGNWGETANYTILLDTSSPSTPQMTEPAKFTNTTQVTFNWTASTDPDSGVDNYSLQVDNSSDFSSPEYYQWVGNVTNKTVTGLTADATYFARVHSRNLAGVNSSWSSSVGTVIDTTAPSITFSKPSSTGVVASQNVVLVLKTDEKAICTYRENAEQYRNFTYTNSTYHETRASTGTGLRTFDVQCKDTIQNTRTATLSFTVSTTSTPSSITLQDLSVFTADVVKTDIIVTTSSSQRLGELGSSSFTVKVDNAPVDASVFDNGAGNYTLVFNAPERNGTYVLKVEIGSASATSTLTVQALLFTVQYVQSGISSNAAERLIYFVAGNFTLGLATDSKSSSQQSTGSALNLTSDAKEGTAYIFVTRVGGNVERVESLLKDRKFLDAINPSFGYAIDRDTFVVFTDLEYDDIALTGNRTLTTGRYNLIIENKGFDSTLNKTKLEVRVQ